MKKLKIVFASLMIVAFLMAPNAFAGDETKCSKTAKATSGCSSKVACATKAVTACCSSKTAKSTKAKSTSCDHSTGSKVTKKETKAKAKKAS